MTRRIKIFLLITVLEIALIAVLHFGLMWWCAEKDVVSRAFFSPGGHTSIIDRLTAVAFFLVRMVAVLLLPGIILERAGRLALILVEERKENMGSELEAHPEIIACTPSLPKEGPTTRK